MKKWKKIISILLSMIMVLSMGSISVQAAEKEADKEVEIILSDSGVTVDGEAASTDASDAVYVGAEIVYYHDGTDSSYGEGSQSDMHSAEEAAAHTVVTITQAGTYRLSGTLSAGQIAIDLGEDAEDDPEAVVTIILDNANVTCTVAPALIFYNVYECGPTDNDSAVVDTSAAGANVIIAAGSKNNFTGSHVARIYKEETTKKLHKYDAAFYSKMSMNVNGDNGDNTGVLNIVADNEGLDAEMHMTINGGTINIHSQDDGINTNEDYVSVTTINGGNITINAGNGAEGDGIDSNGWLVINGGTIYTIANERSPDGGIDADMDILINGGTLYAFGTRNDAVSSSSAQPYMELYFASVIAAGSEITVTESDGTVIWTATTQKRCQYVTLTTEKMKLDTVYNVYVNGTLQCYTGNSSGGMGGNGGFPGMGGNGGFPGMGGSQNSGNSTEFTLTSSTKTFSGVCDSASSGKQLVTFTIEGVTQVQDVNYIEEITAITPSESIDGSLVQITITDDPSEDYAVSCLLSDGLEAINELLPEDAGNYILTVAVISGTEKYTGATQVFFAVAEEEEPEPTPTPEPTPEPTPTPEPDPEPTPEPSENPFTDVAEDQYYYDPVIWAYENGITDGVSDTKFGPDEFCTRGHVVTFLYRAFYK